MENIKVKKLKPRNPFAMHARMRSGAGKHKKNDSLLKHKKNVLKEIFCEV